MELEPTLRFRGVLEAAEPPAHALCYLRAPGLTDDPRNIEHVARIVAPMTNVEWVEVLPFHQMGEFKWKSLGLEYHLAETPTPSDAQVRAALEIFRSAGCRAR